MDNTELIQRLNKELQTALPPHISTGELLQKLAEMVNYLIQTDFQKLVAILYKTDVSETRLKRLLQQYPQLDAGPVIAKLLIEREQQKINSVILFSKKEDEDSCDEEKW